MANQAPSGSVIPAATAPSRSRHLLVVFGSVCIALALYFALLVLAPHLSLLFAQSKDELHPTPRTTIPAVVEISAASEDSVVEKPEEPQLYDIDNALVIEKIGIKLAIPEINHAGALERGTWHRRPHQGNPEIGGNFVLTGHRFGFDWTPAGVARNSAFFHLDKLVPGDVVTVYWNQRRYDYEIVESHQVDPNATWIENQSELHRLTLYTCTLGGEYDGRVVFTARPLFEAGESV